MALLRTPRSQRPSPTAVTPAARRRPARPAYGGLLVSVVVAAGVLAGCGASTTAGAGKAPITLYNGQHPETVDALVTAFEHDTGITVNVRSDDEDVLAAQVLEEGASSPADVILTENSPPLQDLQQHGLLAKVDPSTLAAVPAQYSSPEGRWVGVSARVSVLVYNRREVPVDELPSSILDLAEPRWRGKLAIAPGETDFQSVITAVAARYGDRATLRWLRGLKANAGQRVYPDNETLVAQVNDGQAALGVINHYYWYRLRDEIGASNMHSAEHFFAPGDAGYVVDVSGAAVLASSHHRAEAQRLLAFLVGRQAQEILAHSESYEYPLGSGVVTAKPLVPFSELRPDPISIEQLGNGRSAVALLQQAGLL